MGSVLLRGGFHPVDQFAWGEAVEAIGVLLSLMTVIWSFPARYLVVMFGRVHSIAGLS